MHSSRQKWQFLAIVGLLLATVFSARADLITVLPQMGDLQRWAVFSLGDGATGDRFSRTTYIQGDVGAAGNGNIILGGNTTVDGNVYYRSNGKLGVFGDATITGNRYHDDDSDLDNGVNEAINASDAAFALTPTSSFTTINLRGHQNTTISGAPGETVVLSLKNFLLRGNATFTLQGTTTTAFIINIKKGFSLSDAAKIVLSGGVTWNNVLFNVRGSGSTVTLTDQSSFQGILMANERTVEVRRRATVMGELIANKIRLMGGAQVIRPPIVSP